MSATAAGPTLFVGSEGSGAIIGCECWACRELRLRDPDRIVYGAPAVAAAFQEGWYRGYQRGFDAATEMLTEDEL